MLRIFERIYMRSVEDTECAPEERKNSEWHLNEIMHKPPYTTKEKEKEYRDSLIGLSTNLKIFESVINEKMFDVHFAIKFAIKNSRRIYIKEFKETVNGYNSEVQNMNLTREQLMSNAPRPKLIYSTNLSKKVPHVMKDHYRDIIREKTENHLHMLNTYIKKTIQHYIQVTTI